MRPDAPAGIREVEMHVNSGGGGRHANASGARTINTNSRAASLKALIRVLGDFTMRDDLIEKWRETPSPRHFERLIGACANLKDEFRNEGFYERFPAKGQIERVRVIEQRLLREIGA